MALTNYTPFKCNTNSEKKIHSAGPDFRALKRRWGKSITILYSAQRHISRTSTQYIPDTRHRKQQQF